MNNIEALIESFEKNGIHLFMDGENTIQNMKTVNGSI